MAEFHVSFIIDARHLGDVLTAVHPFKVQQLDLKPVVTPGGKGRGGGAKAWQVVANAVRAAGKPLKPIDVKPALAAAGYSPGGVQTALTTALERKAVRHTKEGWVAGTAPSKGNGT